MKKLIKLAVIILILLIATLTVHAADFCDSDNTPTNLGRAELASYKKLPSSTRKAFCDVIEKLIRLNLDTLQISKVQITELFGNGLEYRFTVTNNGIDPITRITYKSIMTGTNVAGSPVSETSRTDMIQNPKSTTSEPYLTLQPGESYTETAANLVGGHGPENPVIEVILDPDEKIQDANRDNNRAKPMGCGNYIVESGEECDGSTAKCKDMGKCDGRSYKTRAATSCNSTCHCVYSGAWSSGKIVKDKCGVKCTSNSHCSGVRTCSNYKCYCYGGDSYWIIFQDDSPIANRFYDYKDGGWRRETTVSSASKVRQDMEGGWEPFESITSGLVGKNYCEGIELIYQYYTKKPAYNIIIQQSDHGDCSEDYDWEEKHGSAKELFADAKWGACD